MKRVAFWLVKACCGGIAYAFTELCIESHPSLRFCVLAGSLGGCVMFFGWMIERRLDKREEFGSSPNPYIVPATLAMLAIAIAGSSAASLWLSTEYFRLVLAYSIALVTKFGLTVAQSMVGAANVRKRPATE